MAAKRFLTGYKIAEQRFKTVGYGEERLLDPGDTEFAHAKNRRVEVIVYLGERAAAE